MTHLLLSLASLTLAIGARISIRSRNNASTAMSSRIAPVGEPWLVGMKYACMQKWQDGGVASDGKYVEKFCLVDLDKAHLLASLHLQFGQLDECVSKESGSHKMRLCAVKGSKPDGRLSWKSRCYVSKSCFRYSRAERSYPVIEGAVTEQGCELMQKSSSVHDQGQFGEAITKIAEATTTTTSEATTTTLEDPVQRPATNSVRCLSCTDGFVTAIVGDQCICRPAPCGVVGTRNDGLACECMPGLIGHITWIGATAMGDCIAEAKHLFSVGPQSVWEHKGKEIKCCISTVREPTQLQDITATLLPSKGSFMRSDATGCGYMFGDHYHNGMKPYKSRSYSTCPVSVVKLMEASGESFDVIKKLMKLED